MPLLSHSSQADGPQDHQARFKYSLKEESGRGYLEHNASTNRPEERSGQSSTSLFHWQPQSGRTSHAPTGWSGTDTVASDPLQRHRTSISDTMLKRAISTPSYTSSALPSGLTSAAMTAEASSFSMRDDVLQSEFFVGALSSQKRRSHLCQPRSVHCTDAANRASPNRIGAGPDPQLSNAAFPNLVLASVAPTHRPLHAPPRRLTPFSASTSARSASTPALPLHRVRASGADHGRSRHTLWFEQAPTTDVSPAFSLPTSFAQPLVPSQAHMVPAVPVHQALHSQADSSQSSVFLPSLTASQTEYLGPNAISHRRTINRVWSSASHAFDASSQTRGDISSTQMTAGEYDESLGRQAAAAMKLESQEDMAIDTSSSVPNFNKPHDLFPAQRAAWNEEGGSKSARREDGFLEGSTLTAARRSLFPVVGKGFRIQRRCLPVPPSFPRIRRTIPRASLLLPPRWVRPSNSAFVSELERAEASERDGRRRAYLHHRRSAATLLCYHFDFAYQRRSVAACHRSIPCFCAAMSRPYAPISRDARKSHTSSAENDPCGRTLLSSTMTGSQKAHSPEEVFALLSLASLQSSDATLQEEGHRLICFMWGLVLLSYRHTLHLAASCSRS